MSEVREIKRMKDKELLFSLSKAKGDFVVQPFKGSGREVDDMMKNENIKIETLIDGKWEAWSE